MRGKVDRSGRCIFAMPRVARRQRGAANGTCVCTSRPWHGTMHAHAVTLIRSGTQHQQPQGKGPSWACTSAARERGQWPADGVTGLCGPAVQHTCRRCTVSMLCANTSRPELARTRTCAMLPLKSGVRHSTSICGDLRLMSSTVRAKWAAPPSATSSRSTDVSTM